MEDKKIKRVWAVSLLLIGITTIIWVGSKLMGAELPDVLVRTLGVVNLVALPVLSFTSTKMFQKK